MAFVEMTTRSAGYVVPASEWNQLIANDNYLRYQVSAQLLLLAAGMKPSLTSGCAALADLEMGTNKQVISTLDFDTTTQEYAQSRLFAMPSDYAGGTFTAKALWAHPATTTNFGVAWQFELVAYINDGALDASWGTAVVVTDTGGTTSDFYVTDASAAITPAGSPAGGCGMLVRVSRKVADAADTMAVDAKLLGVQLNYVRA